MGREQQRGKQAIINGAQATAGLILFSRIPGLSLTLCMTQKLYKHIEPSFGSSGEGGDDE